MMVKGGGICPARLRWPAQFNDRSRSSPAERWHAILLGMTKLDDIEKAIARLAPDELTQFREWFEAFDGARFDEKIERDAASGKLDRMAEQAVADFRQDHAREL
jgi:hypothetical protein